jgi:hypothetical protein
MKADKIFWGLIFVFVGGIFLLENFGFIDFTWNFIWRFWPFILIISGINMLSSKINPKVGLIATLLITLFALTLITIKGLQKSSSNSFLDWSFSDQYQTEDDSDQIRMSGDYAEEFNSAYKVATLNIKGGASQFEIKESTDKLFQSDIKEAVSPYFLKKTASDSSVVLDFKSKGEKYNFSDDDYSEIKMRLNTQPVWSINLAMGAGETNFDFRNFKLKNINLKGGAASFKIKIGDLYPNVNLVAETGVAEIDIRVPKEMGCRINTSTGLSSTDFDGFVKKTEGVYETPNYSSSTKKVNLTLKGGLSEFTVKRY